MVVPAFGHFLGVGLGFGLDFFAVCAPVGDFFPLAGPFVCGGVVEWEAAHLPKDGDAFIDVFLEFLRLESSQVNFSGRASAFAPSGEGDFIVKLACVCSGTSCGGKRG